MPKHIKQQKPHTKKESIIMGAAAFLLSLFFYFAFYGGLALRSYEIISGKLSPGENVRIVLIADLHSRTFGEKQETLISAILKQHPDVIILSGDILDDEEPEEGSILFFEGITDIAPVYYVSGNHEYWTGKYDAISSMIKGYGITVLSNERRYININGTALCICGIDDPYVFKYSDDIELLKNKNTAGLLTRYSDLNDDTYNILAAHRPEFFGEYAKYDFDLVLAGHTHGGQIRLPPFINGFYAANQGWFPKYAGGLYSSYNTNMIVSRGLGLIKIPRVFNSPEVVVIDIKGKS